MLQGVIDKNIYDTILEKLWNSDPLQGLMQTRYLVTNDMGGGVIMKSLGAGASTTKYLKVMYFLLA